eukprot:scaffold17977_cov96-Isochrysis_galbana.AAC.2
MSAHGKSWAEPSCPRTPFASRRPAASPSVAPSPPAPPWPLPPCPAMARRSPLPDPTRPPAWLQAELAAGLETLWPDSSFSYGVKVARRALLNRLGTTSGAVVCAPPE